MTVTEVTLSSLALRRLLAVGKRNLFTDPIDDDGEFANFRIQLASSELDLAAQMIFEDAGAFWRWSAHPDPSAAPLSSSRAVRGVQTSVPTITAWS